MEQRLLSLSGIRSKHLLINTNTGIIKLSGLTEHGFFRTQGNAQLYAKRLKASRIWLSSSDASFVRIDPRHILNVFADRSSMVVYSHRPEFSKQIFKINYANVVYHT